ncbi:MAG: hypothetical protein ABI557_20845, partial [Aureliella sp.]
MARRNNRSTPDTEYAEYAAVSPRAKRRGKLKYIFGLAILAVMLLVVLLPTIVARRSVLVPLIERFAGIAPLKVELEGVQAGWFTPITATGLQLFDGDGRLLVKVAQVVTEKGIWSWIRSSSDLGTIRVSGV